MSPLAADPPGAALLLASGAAVQLARVGGLWFGVPQCPGSPGCRELHHKGDFLPVEVCEQDRPNTAIDVFQQEKGGIGKSLLRPEKDDRNGILIFELVSAFFPADFSLPPSCSPHNTHAPRAD